MKILVCGGRDFTDYAFLSLCLDKLNLEPKDTIIHGDAKGADRMAGKYAEENGIQIEKYPAAWHIHGKRAGPIRNQKMLEEGNPDLVLAFPGGTGTADMVRRAEKAYIPVNNYAHVVKQVDAADLKSAG